MDKIDLLRKRKEELLAAGREIRARISALCDESSFMELSAFSFSKGIDGEDAFGDGVVTGFATIDGYPFYIVAQNFAIFHGGLSKGNCEKIAKTLDAAEKNDTPVIFLLESQGVRVGEGVDVLEGIGELLRKTAQLKGSVPLFAVLLGEVYGCSAAIASLCDCVIFIEGSALCLGSPLVLSAKAGKSLKAEEVGGYDVLSHAVLPALSVNDMKEAAAVILQISDLVGLSVVNAELNESAPALNAGVTAEGIASLLEGHIELGANSCPEVKTILGRLGGIAVAAVLFDGVTLNAQNVKKIKNFAKFAASFGLPFVTFVDCVGVEMTLEANNSALYREIGEYLSALEDAETAKIAVVTGRAVGLGYSLFAAKSVGFDYSYALATAQISLFGSAEGARIELGEQGEKAALRYEEEIADPVHAAKGGYLDSIIEPCFLKQYLIASLQTLLK